MQAMPTIIDGEKLASLHKWFVNQPYNVEISGLKENHIPFIDILFNYSFAGMEDVFFTKGLLFKKKRFIDAQPREEPLIIRRTPLKPKTPAKQPETKKEETIKPDVKKPVKKVEQVKSLF